MTGKTGGNKPANRMTNKQQRVPVSGQRDILTVYGKDPSKEYRFVLDNNDGGLRIQQFIRGGWEFTDANTVTVGEENVWKSEKSGGSVVRKPAGEGKYLYLMEIRKEWYDEDQRSKAERIEESEASITGKRSPESNELGQYGEVKIETKDGK